MSDWSNASVAGNASLLRAFGETVYYQTAGGAGDPVALTVIWNDAEAQMPPGVRATAWLLESSLGGAAPAKNDLITRGQNTYRLVDQRDVIAFQRDGGGGITLFLRQIAHAPDA